MTERTRDPQATNSNHEAIDLTDLHASQSTQALRAEITQAANTDLASASIQSISVVRLSPRPERRKLTSPSLAASEGPEQSQEQKKAAHPRPRADARFGVLKNPFYKYEGNILERCITLLANLLKVIEISLLKSFKPQPPPAPQKVTVVKPKRRGPDGREIEEELAQERDDTREREPSPLNQVRE